MRLGTFVISLGVTLAGGFLLGAAWHEHRDGASPAGQRLRQQGEQHAQEIAALSQENLAWQERAQALEERVADVEFLAAHAAGLLRGSLSTPPAYDATLFLRRNPEAQRYFPYLLDAAKKYEDIWPVDPMFAVAILKQESDFGRSIVSRAGALGDAQFIASTAARYGLRVTEPVAWQRGRESFRDAEGKRRAAREVRELYLREMRQGVTSTQGKADVRNRLTANAARHADRLAQYYTLLDEAERLEASGNEAYEVYKNGIERALERAQTYERADVPVPDGGVGP
ncbi:MAG: transglycosylase SLT domain-containing protein, partial [Myxococcota bacterium]